MLKLTKAEAAISHAASSDKRYDHRLGAVFFAHDGMWASDGRILANRPPWNDAPFPPKGVGAFVIPHRQVKTDALIDAGIVDVTVNGEVVPDAWVGIGSDHFGMLESMRRIFERNAKPLKGTKTHKFALSRTVLKALLDATPGVEHYEITFVDPVNPVVVVAMNSASDNTEELTVVAMPVVKR